MRLKAQYSRSDARAVAVALDYCAPIPKRRRPTAQEYNRAVRYLNVRGGCWRKAVWEGNAWGFTSIPQHRTTVVPALGLEGITAQEFGRLFLEEAAYLRQALKTLGASSCSPQAAFRPNIQQLPREK